MNREAAIRLLDGLHEAQNAFYAGGSGAALERLLRHLHARDSSCPGSAAPWSRASTSARPLCRSGSASTRSSGRTRSCACAGATRPSASSASTARTSTCSPSRSAARSRSTPVAWRARSSPSNRASWEEYVEHHGVEVFTPKTPAGREALFAELEATRERGYAISDEDVTPGIAAIGAPIFDHTGRVRAGLSLGGLRDTLFGHESRALEMLLEGTRGISRALGHDASKGVA